MVRGSPSGSLSDKWTIGTSPIPVRRKIRPKTDFQADHIDIEIFGFFHLHGPDIYMVQFVNRHVISPIKIRINLRGVSFSTSLSFEF